MSESFAIWYEPTVGNKELDVDLHVNLWKLPESNTNILRKTFGRFVDFGIRTTEAQYIKSLFIGIPLKYDVSKEKKEYEKENDENDIKLSDLGKVLCNNDKLLPALFNEDYEKRTNVQNPKFSAIHLTNNGDLQFHVCHIDVKNDVTVKYCYGYKIFKIDVCATGSIQDCYFRFRLIGSSLTDMLSELEKPSNARLQSAFSIVEVIDFRVNEKRNITNNSLQFEMSKGIINFKKFNFFFMCSSTEEISFFSHGPFKRCRTLEADLWKSYVNLSGNYIDTGKKNNLLVYQWSIKSRNSINAMIKTKFENNNWATIILYVIILGILTISFNLITNLISTW
ncbi:hypothetical protein [Desulfosporosinus lacus]|uniref:Uncharacterized protein n=1 Tax=Desulfosporosinus lacus DSM 15449 TaxID=1121420 RepID=A0A1M5SAP7_9FIRM|nr:hypothetical protein [Desulfosporosinus lacus]SHH34993.1 hypothetical protein SAMN02746098_00783 [Desulfosporosinus lacus DSM 15449]